jgi:DNA-binding protein HU-beta
MEKPLNSAAIAQMTRGDSNFDPTTQLMGDSPTMNKNELIGAVAEASGLSRSDATKAVEGVFDTITRSLSKGDEVRLVGFGTFSVAKRKASTGRNPRTGAPMTIKASTQPKFKAGKGLKDSVN